jgi:hypothetical protein
MNQGIYRYAAETMEHFRDLPIFFIPAAMRLP